MTDRYAGFVVSIEGSIREDDAVHIINALKMVKGVINVKPIELDSIADMNADMRVKHDVRQKLLKWFDDLK